MAEIGFTGTQDGTTAAQREVLRQWFLRCRNRGARWLHNGDCVGADKDAGDIWIGLGGKLHLHPPDKSGKRAFQSCDAMERPLPYLERNRIIVERSDFLIAAPRGTEELRSGTWSTVRHARKLVRPILLIFPDGSELEENWDRKAA